jgi:hypothetical protein
MHRIYLLTHAKREISKTPKDQRRRISEKLIAEYKKHTNKELLGPLARRAKERSSYRRVNITRNNRHVRVKKKKTKVKRKPRPRFSEATRFPRTTYHRLETKNGKGSKIAVHRARSKREFNQLSSPGTNNGTTLHSAPTVRRDFVRDGHACCEVKTWVLLNDITIYPGTKTGARLPYGATVFSPSGFGSILELFSKQFQKFKIHNVELHFRTAVATNKDGAICLYYFADSGIVQMQLGDSAKRHSATADKFVQTPVWKDCHLHIVPSDVLKKYFTDNTNKEADFTSVGMITCMAGSDFDWISSAPVTVGSLYALVHIEFYTPKLSDTIGLVYEYEIVLDFVSHVANQGDSIYARDSGISVTQTTTVVDKTCIFYGPCVECTVVDASSNPLAVDSPVLNGSTDVLIGQMYYIKRWRVPGGNAHYGVYCDFDSARDATYDGSSGVPDFSDDTLEYANTGTYTGVWKIAAKTLIIEAAAL